MPPRGRDWLYSQAERRLRDAVITFENGKRIEISEIRAMSVEPDEFDDMPIASVGSREATFMLEGVDPNDINGIIGEMARQSAEEVGFQAFTVAMHRLIEESQDARDAVAQAAKVIADGCKTSFIDALNSLWEKIGDDFDLADEEEYVKTDPISFDELMGA